MPAPGTADPRVRPRRPAIAAIAIAAVTSHFGPTSSAKLETREDIVEERQKQREDQAEEREKARQDRRQEPGGSGSGPG